MFAGMVGAVNGLVAVTGIGGMGSIAAVAVIGGLATGAAALGAAIGSGTGLMALVGGGTAGGAAALATVSIGTAIGVGVGAGFLGAGLVFMSKPNSGKIRYSDGTGTNPDGSKMSQSQAEQAYKNSKDPVYRAKLKRWMKGVGYRQSHLKGLVLPLLGAWLYRFLGFDS